MSLKNIRYTRLETEESEGDEDESPPTHVVVNNESLYVKGSRWNHIDNLDDFFERVYEYQQKSGLWAIFFGDILELIQFLFIVLFTTFLVTCLRWDHLFADKIKVEVRNSTHNRIEQRDVAVGDLFDFSELQRINLIVVLFLLMAFSFWIHRLFRAAVRLCRFCNIRNFYSQALYIRPDDLRNTQWSDVVIKLKSAQKEHKMNIQKQDLTELDVYHRILRFKNYMVAMVNKGVLPCKFNIPFYGEKVFFTQGLKFNYELLLFWPSLKAPFKNSFYLREEYKSASKKRELVENLQFRITILALLNLIFCPAIFLYQLIYSFYSYGELLKNQPGIFGRRKWSLYGRWHLRDFNELEHEFSLRLNRAYKPSVKYMDLFVHPLLVITAKNLAFIAGSILAVVLFLTIIQEDLLTAHNILTIITLLGLIVTVCRIFIPSENQVWQPAGLMQRILGEIHYMPDLWKQQPHTVQVHRQFTHVFQFTVMYVIDELLSPLITPFILYFVLRHKASDIIDFLRNFTIDVTGVGDVCSFAGMDIKKHGNPEWLPGGASRASQYEQAELGKTEISLMHFSRKNPDWTPGEDGAQFMSQLKESVCSMHTSYMSTSSNYQARPHPPGYTHPGVSLTYLPGTEEDSISPNFHQQLPQGYSQARKGYSQAASSDAMQWSIWSAVPEHQYRVLGDTGGGEGVAGGVVDNHTMIASTLDTLQIHQLHDLKKVSSDSTSNLMNSDPLRPINRLPNLSISDANTGGSWTAPYTVKASNESVALSGFENRTNNLKEPLLLPQQPPPTTPPISATEHAQEFQDNFHTVGNFEGQNVPVVSDYHQYGEDSGNTSFNS